EERLQDRPDAGVNGRRLREDRAGQHHREGGARQGGDELTSTHGHALFHVRKYRSLLSTAVIPRGRLVPSTMQDAGDEKNVGRPVVDHLTRHWKRADCGTELPAEAS